MQAATLQPAPQQAPPPSAQAPTTGPQAAASGDLWDFAEECLTQTAALLHEVRAASDQQIQHAIHRAREQHAAGRPYDLLEALAREQGVEEEHISRAILGLGDQVAAVMTPYVPLVPFAGKLIAPSALYEAYDRVHRIARVLLAPVVFAEDSDAIGTASANPVAANLLTREITAAVHKRFGIRPFISTSRLDYESWTFLIRKHFEL